MKIFIFMAKLTFLGVTKVFLKRAILIKIQELLINFVNFPHKWPFLGSKMKLLTFLGIQPNFGPYGAYDMACEWRQIEKKQFLHFLVRFEWFHLYSLGQFKCHFCNHDEMPKVATFKGSSVPIHFILKIDVESSRFRHTVVRQRLTHFPVLSTHKMCQSLAKDCTTTLEIQF